jgi:predicted methyltransferase
MRILKTTMRSWLAVALAAALLSACAKDGPAREATAPTIEPEVAEVPAGPGGCPADAGDGAREAIAAAVAGPERSEANRARDAARNPVETLAFFGLRPEMTVVELWPGGGWYTEILAPVLAEAGRLRITNFDPDGPEDQPVTRYARTLRDRLASSPELFAKVEVRTVAPPDSIDLGEAGSADLVITFRNNHSWIRMGIQEHVYRAAFAVLRPCGVLGVVQHRAAPGTDPATFAEKGYVTEEVVIAAAEAAGFVLADRSEVNANPRDTKDHPAGVWNLPPSLRAGDEDRERYVAIGESDRMTLRFVKPAAAE